MKPSELSRMQEVRRIGKDRAGEASSTLADAFKDDPLFVWLRTGAETKKKSDQPWWETIIKNLPPFTQVHSMGDISAVSLWFTSEELSKQIQQQNKMKIQPADVTQNDEIATLSYEHFGLNAEIFLALKEKTPKEAHWYLAAIGTQQKCFGQGKGTKLLQAMTKQLDEEGLPAYLEASTKKSAALYLRHGFEHIEEVSLMGSPPLYLMWRDPK